MSETPETYVTKDGTEWREPTAEELKPGHPVREAIENLLESWAPNYMSDSGRVSSYDEWVERVEGLEFPGTYVRMDIGSDTTEAPYATIKRIAQAVAKELR